MAEVIQFPQKEVVIEAEEVVKYVQDKSGIPEDIIYAVLYLQQEYLLSKVKK